MTEILPTGARDKVFAALILFTVLFSVGISTHGFASGIGFVLLLMAAAYSQNTCASLNSRAGNRNSAVYYAFTTVFSSVVFFATLNMLVSKQMTLMLFVPYTVATVLGSVSGGKLSMKVEKALHITTRSDKAAAASRMANTLLLIVMGLLIVMTVLMAKRTAYELVLLAGIAFLKNASFSAVRRSRNTNNGVYHAAISLVDGVLWYFMYRQLTAAKLSFDLFPPYMFGSVLGGMFGQRMSMLIESAIGTSADSHLEGKKESSPLIPAGVLAVAGIFFAGATGILSTAWGIMALAICQNISFALISRARSRNNFAYHAIASIFSNGVWYLTFRLLVRDSMPLILMFPYVACTITGSLLGIAISKKIEEWLGAKSDSHVTAAA